MKIALAVAGGIAKGVIAGTVVAVAVRAAVRAVTGSSGPPPPGTETEHPTVGLHPHP
jgi:hypothetical protein